MSLPIQVHLRLYHLKIHTLALASRLFGLSRTTFDQYRHQAEQGRLASLDGTPRVHGSAKPPQFFA